MYCKKIFLESEDTIRKFAIADIEKQLGTSKAIVKQLKIKHDLPDNILTTINLELAKYSIPPISYCLSYVRPKGNFQGIHIDGDRNGIIKSAINIPLKGSKDSYQIWYKGDFTTTVVQTENNVYHNILWKSIAVEDYRAEIDQAHLVRVDQPHSAIAGNIEDRWVFTMRFQGNPNFQDLVNNV